MTTIKVTASQPPVPEAAHCCTHFGYVEPAVPKRAMDLDLPGLLILLAVLGALVGMAAGWW